MKKIIILLILCLGIYGSSCNASWSVTDLKKQVTPLLETKNTDPGIKEFAAIHIYGFQESGEEVWIYGWCLRMSFAFKEDQVVDLEGSSVPLAIGLKKGPKGLQLSEIKEAKDGNLYNPSIKKIFPTRYHAEISKGLSPELNGEIKGRVLKAASQYYKTSKTRLIKRIPPKGLQDPHQHRENIYNLYNLANVYRNFTITTNSDVVVKDGDEKVVSPDGKYTAWIGLNEGFQVFIKSNDVVSELVFTNHSRPFAGNLAWKKGNILVFDQINGLNTFGDGEDHGVHLEYDCEKKELVWAVPFGTLDGPVKLTENSPKK